MRTYLIALLFLSAACSDNKAETKNAGTAAAADSTKPGAAASPASRPGPPLDTAKYNRLMTYLANGDTTGRWPVKEPLPLPGAILPFNRVNAYYGNRFSG